MGRAGQASQDPRGEGGAQRMRRLGPGALRTQAPEGGGRGDAGSLWLVRPSRGWERSRETPEPLGPRDTAGPALRGGRPGKWLDSRCVVKVRLVGFFLFFFFFETRVTGRRHGSAVVLGKAGAPTVEQACPRHCDAPDFRGE